MKKLILGFMILIIPFMVISVDASNNTKDKKKETITFESIEESTIDKIVSADEAGYIERTTRVVIGSDSRTEITNKSIQPYNGIVAIEVYYESKLVPGQYFPLPSIATGFMLDDNTVLTGGHVVYGRATGYPVMPAFVRVYSGGGPSDNDFMYQSETIDVSYDYINVDDGHKNDYAIITLSQSVDSSIKKFQLQKSVGIDDAINVIGFPSDKPSNTMWKGSGRVEAFETRTILYDNDTYEGMSGSPVLNYNNEVVGIHVGAVTINSIYYNVARDIDVVLYNLLMNDHL